MLWLRPMVALDGCIWPEHALMSSFLKSLVLMGSLNRASIERLNSSPPCTSSQQRL